MDTRIKAIGRPKTKLLPGNSKNKSILALRSKIALQNEKILKNLYQLAFESKNEKTRLQANAYLFDKLVPNERASSAETDKPGINFKFFGGGYIPTTTPNAPSVGGTSRPTPIQSARLASPGSKNLNVNNRGGETGVA